MLDFDVVVIGGGPAGAAMGCYLAKAGKKCLVVERDLFPRPHVGESLVPASTRVFRELGFLHKLEEAQFPRKYGAAWTSASMEQSDEARMMHEIKDFPQDDVDAHYADVSFHERKQEGVPQDYTYHVNRELFDALLLRHASELGAQVLQGVAARDVRFDLDGSVEIQLEIAGKPVFLRTRVVVDASGRRCFLGRKLGLYKQDPVFDQFAVHTWFRNMDRGGAANRADYIYVHFLPVSNSWVWQIPITDQITSIGVVTQKAKLKGFRGEHDAFFWDCVGSRPDLLDRIRQGEQIRKFSVEADYSYSMTSISGDGYLLIGDAARFVDPIFSTGVSIALNSARFASRDLLAALDRPGPITSGDFATYEATIRRGMRNWYEFISVYYRLNVLFTAFVNDSKYRIDVLKLLQGDVYDEDQPEVLNRMKSVLAVVEGNPQHGLHKFLGSLRADSQMAGF